jgi:hypothetical protein
MILLAAPAALAADRTPREEFTREFAKTLPWTAGQTVRFEHRMGSITVHTHQLKEVQIRASLRCSADRLEDAKILQPHRNRGADYGQHLIQTKYPQEESFWNRETSGIRYPRRGLPETAPEVRNRLATSVTGWGQRGNRNNGH